MCVSISYADVSLENRRQGGRTEFISRHEFVPSTRTSATDTIFTILFHGGRFLIVMLGNTNNLEVVGYAVKSHAVRITLAAKTSVIGRREALELPLKRIQ